MKRSSRMISRLVARRRWILALLGCAVALGADSEPPRPANPTTADGSRRNRPALPEVIRTREFEDVDGAVRPQEAHKTTEPQAQWTAREIDAIIDRDLAAAKTPPAPLTSDEAFLRRLSLDLVGRPPTIVAIRQFTASRDPNKRATAIDELLKDSDFGQNWARYWRDVIAFRSPNENERQIDYPRFVTWLADELNENKSWREIATAVITATGRTDENGAALFALAEEASAVELAGEVSRVFLGIQIQCAQCHDHPSDPWKRRQFHEFAAFFSGVKSKRVQRPGMGQKAIFEITNAGPTRYAMVDLKDPEKKIPVSPRFFLNESPQVGEQVKIKGRLALAAGYVTSPDNPWFARAFINRVWSTLIGEGFYDIVDDLGPTRTAHTDDLLDGLADQWRERDFDIRWLFQTILNTKAYARDSRSTNSAAGRVPFAANVPSRLRADQIYDALAQTFNIEQNIKKRAVVALAGAKKGGKQAGLAQAMKEGNVEDVVRKLVDQTFGVDPSTPSGDVVGTIPQALYLMNSPLVTRSVQARPGTMLGQLLASAGSPKEAVEVLYLKTLARRPNPKELSTCLRYLDTVGDRREGFEDILWGLVNSTEFISRR